VFSKEQQAAHPAHHQHWPVIAQVTALNACLELIAFKAGLYEESVAAGSTDPI
jgi:hypothetical protein